MMHSEQGRGCVPFFCPLIGLWLSARMLGIEGFLYHADC